MVEPKLCQCGRLARHGGLCFSCHSKHWRETHPDQVKLYRKRSWKKQKEKNALGVAFRAFFRAAGHREYEGEKDITYPQRLHLKVEYICSKCHETKKGFRTHIDGKSYCKSCAVKIRDKKIADEIYKEFQAQEAIDKLDPFGDMRETCTKLGTCDILHFHHELLKNDPERMRTDFLVDMICGEEKAKKYKNKRHEQQQTSTNQTA